MEDLPLPPPRDPSTLPQALVWKLSRARGQEEGAAPLQPLDTPANPTQAFVEQLQDTLLRASWSGHAEATAEVLPVALCHHIITAVTAIIKKEPTLLELTPSVGELPVTVVGDTHGHFQDLCNLLDEFGRPSADKLYIFNGDFVDRGSWGLETLLLLLTYKWLLPSNVFLLRGNHEASYCTTHYGFKNELLAKYGKAAGKTLYKDVLKLFAQLPLAALVEGNTLILHGGLWRAPPEKQKGQPKWKNLEEMPQHVRDGLRTGSLQDLRSTNKGGVDPDPDVRLSQLIASDVLWSDPSSLPGHEANELRGVGTRWGPDVTEAFLRDNGLRLIIRSHEGPDARYKRPSADQMPNIDKGFSIDHDTPSGKVMTLFSAPCYPMHQAAGELPFHNSGAVIKLTAPDYATPAARSFVAVLPRPKALLFYAPSSASDSETEELIEESELQGTPSTSSIGCASEPAAACTDTATSSGPLAKAEGEGGAAAPAAAAVAGHGVRRSSRNASAAAAALASSQPVAAAVFGPHVAADSSSHAVSVATTVGGQPKRRRDK